MNEKLIADWLLGCGPMEDAIEEAINDYIWKQKAAYGIEYTKAELDINPEIFKDRIQKWLDSCYEEGIDPFEDNECVACDYWLEDEGYELIQKAIES